MEDINEKILKEGYGIKLLSGYKSRKGFICYTDKGMKELKKVGLNEKNILFENDVKEHLYKKGFLHLNRFLPTIRQTPFFHFDGMNYVLENYVETQSMDDTSDEAWICYAQILANIHLCGIGLNSEYGKKNMNRIPNLYEKRRIELIKIKKRINRQSHYNSMDLIILKNFEYYMKKVQQAEKILKVSQYEKCVWNSKNKITICHNAFKPENIRLTENGTIIITGFEKCTYDCNVTDLAEYLRRYLKTENCNNKTIQGILQSYHEVRKISKEEFNIIYGMLIYPYKFLKLCNEYYNKRRVCVSEAMIQRMEKCVFTNMQAEKILSQIKL